MGDFGEPQQRSGADARRALVIVPTYEESATIGTVLERLFAAADDRTEVLVVDDGSADGTDDIVKAHPLAGSRVHLMERGAKLGLGSAYRDGFAWGMARDFDALVEMDADLSHDPADVPRLLAGLEGAHLVIGSRYVPGGSTHGWGIGRKILSRFGNLYVRVVTGLPVADATAGYRAYRTSTLRAIGIDSITSEGYSFQVEGAIRTWRAGYRIAEVPVAFSEREEGQSKMHGGTVREALRRVIAWGIEGPRTPRTVREVAPWTGHPDRS